MVSGVDNTAEVQGLTFQGENPMSCLNWLCLAMTLLEILFREYVVVGINKHWQSWVVPQTKAEL